MEHEIRKIVADRSFGGDRSAALEGFDGQLSRALAQQKPGVLVSNLHCQTGKKFVVAKVRMAKGESFVDDDWEVAEVQCSPSTLRMVEKLLDAWRDAPFGMKGNEYDLAVVVADSFAYVIEMYLSALILCSRVENGMHFVAKLNEECMLLMAGCPGVSHKSIVARASKRAKKICRPPSK
jgi:hypothetical protein